MTEPLVSVNIPAYNATEFIEETLSSALGQSYRNIEVIVLDDGSTDRTAEIVKKVQKSDNRVRYYFQENQGISGARNRLFELSKGEYVAFLDHDDQWLPTKLQVQIALFNQNPDLGIVFAKALTKYEDGRCIDEFTQRKPKRGKVFYDYLLSLNFMPLCTVVIKKDVLAKYIPFSKRLCLSEDWELFLRVARDYKFDYLDQPLAIYNARADSLMRRNVLRELEEVSSILDFWSSSDSLVLANYKRRFLRAKAQFNFYKVDYLKNSREFKQAKEELINCIKIDPTWMVPYLNLPGALFCGR